MLPTSAVIITYNEEINLRLLLPKLYWCNEIIVVDCGSTDNTLAICKQYNCNLYYRKFDNFAEQKKYAVALAKNDWVLCIDADEILSDELVEELKTEMINPKFDGYLISMKLVFLGKTFQHGKETTRYYLRLFNKTKGGFNNNIVHEKIEINGIAKKLSNCIYHYSYRSVEQYFDKLNKYTTMGAELSYIKAKKKSFLGIVFSVPLYFCKYYFLEKNILNGKKGFYWAMLNAQYHFVKYLKLNEIYSNQLVMQEYGIPPQEILKINSGAKPIEQQLNGFRKFFENNNYIFFINEASYLNVSQSGESSIVG